MLKDCELFVMIKLYIIKRDKRAFVIFNTLTIFTNIYYIIYIYFFKYNINIIFNDKNAIGVRLRHILNLLIVLNYVF